MITKIRNFSIFLLTLFTSTIVFADDPTVATNAASIAQIQQYLNLVWVLIAAVLVFMMQPGFALVEAGLTRAKNVVNIMYKNLMDFAIGTIVYWAIGYGLMFGTSILGFIGGSYFFGIGIDLTSGLGIGALIFQTVFAATAATIVSGAMAERTNFKAYIFYTVFITGFIYPVVGHWIWGGGWLSKLGMIDFAGSTVVHSVGGWAALVGAIVLGPRIGKYGPDGESKAMPGHNMAFVTLGVFLLWFGWFGFNAGSELAADMAIAMIAVTTNLAAAAGGLVATFITWKLYGKPDLSMALNGVLAGLVAITAGCAAVSPLSAVLIGAIAGVIIVFSVAFFDKVLKIDDPVGAISVHAVCGAFGTLAVGFFATNGGLLFGGGANLLKVQAIGVGSVFVWVVATSFIVFKIADVLLGLRVSREDELKGLDISEHGLEGYSGFQVFANE
ncbi:MAG: ammonium transporter [Candidatus Margulisbacteria bacterium GWF2_35_9]|nr:MAG: ammonium transporter [Candidatus Margulisbacteria bacterium GWF2_35_9]